MIRIETTDRFLKVILMDALDCGTRCRLGGRRDGVTFKPIGAAVATDHGMVTFYCVAQAYDSPLPSKRKAKVKAKRKRA